MTQADDPMHTKAQSIAIEADPSVAVPVGAAEFTLALPAFEGPLQLLLHLIESRELDILTVPLAEVADAYVEHLARTPVDVVNLSEFVVIAAQLIYLKSKRMLPAEPLPPLPGATDEVDEDELRRRLIEYRALRDAAAVARRAGRHVTDDASRAARVGPAGDAVRADAGGRPRGRPRDARRHPGARGTAARDHGPRDHDRPADRGPASRVVAWRPGRAADAPGPVPIADRGRRHVPAPPWSSSEGGRCRRSRTTSSVPSSSNRLSRANDRSGRGAAISARSSRRCCSSPSGR